MSYTLTKEGRRKLCELLVEQFNKDEFKSFLNKVGDEDAEHQVVEGRPHPTNVEEAVKYLRRRGSIGEDLFKVWVGMRPNLKGEIEDLEQDLQVRGDVRSNDDIESKIEATGDTKQLRIICKVTGPGFVKSTKAYEVPGGCLVQVSTKEKNLNKTFAIAEALTFVPGVRLVPSGDDDSWRFERTEQGDDRQ